MHTLQIAQPEQTAREFLAAQLDADGHTVHEADSIQATTAKLCTHAIDVLILADLTRPADAARGLCRVGTQNRVSAVSTRGAAGARRRDPRRNLDQAASDASARTFRMQPALVAAQRRRQ